jgi:hypothetical protein
METKIFLIDEHKETIFDSEQNQEWLTLVRELGLEVQEKLLNTDKGVLSPLPFPAMTEAEREILYRVFNSQVNYKKFASEAIPLSCLSAIALCEKEKYFHKIEVWYSEQVVDPYIVGVIFDDPSEAEKSWSWSPKKYYKIAQFGEKLKPMSELLPIYDKLRRQELEDSHFNSIKNHETNMKKFEFQINAFSNQ